MKSKTNTVVLEFLLFLLIAAVGATGTIVIASQQQDSSHFKISEDNLWDYNGVILYVSAILLVATVRGITRHLSRDEQHYPLLLPAGYAATTLGLWIQYSQDIHSSVLVFARTVLFGSFLVVGILLWPIKIPKVSWGGLRLFGFLSLLLLFLLPMDISRSLHAIRKVMGDQFYAVTNYLGVYPGYLIPDFNLGEIHMMELAKVMVVLVLAVRLKPENSGKLGWLWLPLVGLFFIRTSAKPW